VPAGEEYLALTPAQLAAFGPGIVSQSASADGSSAVVRYLGPELTAEAVDEAVAGVEEAAGVVRGTAIVRPWDGTDG